MVIAVQFYTRIPVVGRLAAWTGYSTELLRGSAAHFPLAGWLVGGAAAATLLGAGALWPPPVAAVCCVAASIWVTGAFHEDGLADTADALGGVVSPSRALEIMRDSRIGTYGATALVLALLLRALTIATIVDRAGLAPAAVVVLGVHVLSRVPPLIVMRVLPYVGSDGGKAKPMADRVTGRTIVVAALWSVPAAGLLAAALGTPALASTVGLALPLLVMWRLLRTRLGGFTGDGLGATQQLGELGALLAVAASA